MPRVSTFLKTIASYHTTIPNVKDVENSKKQPKVGRVITFILFIFSLDSVIIRWK